MLVSEVMTDNPQTIRRDKRMQAVNTIMNFGSFRHLPVVDENHCLVGVLSQTDVFKASASVIDPDVAGVQRDAYLAFISVEKMMQTEVVTIAPHANVTEAAVRMREHKINCLPVTEGGRVVGIVTAYDLLGALESADV